MGLAYQATMRDLLLIAQICVVCFMPASLMPQSLPTRSPSIASYSGDSSVVTCWPRRQGRGILSLQAIRAVAHFRLGSAPD